MQYMENHFDKRLESKVGWSMGQIGRFHDIEYISPVNASWYYFLDFKYAYGNDFIMWLKASSKSFTEFIVRRNRS